MSSDDRKPERSGGLAWPAHDSGPVPPPPAPERRGDERLTRKPMGAWDRVKFLVLLGGAWLVLVWAAMADDPNLPFADAVRIHARSNAWILVVFAVEVVRQVHYLVSERSAAYHGFWTRLFAGFERRSGRMNDWTRFRMARAVRWLLVLALASVLLGKVYDVSPVQGLFRLPTAIWGAMPMIVQVMFFMFIAVIQFVAIFWFLSRGGVETYFPEDIKTRFSDVWGQDPVVERVKENMLFLENPESIEEKGGYVPGGILLWGPPGTGKTLMAEAVAGETGKPYVFVDPGAFTNMFMGVGILKVKALFRKLRKLAVRYGGVIAFFDEADSLGNRGAGVSAGFAAGADPHAWDRLTACNGLSYTSPATASMVLRGASATAAPPDRGPGLVSRFVMGAGMGGGGMGTLQALLAELSGLKKPRGFVNRVVRRSLGMRPKPPPKYRLMIMMATNMPQSLDEALLRPGRVDRIYKVGYPSKDGRKRTYEGYFAKVSHSLDAAQIEKLAVMTPYATGAKIKDLVNESLIVAIRDGRSSITWSDVMRAKQLKDLGPPEDVEYIQRERHAVAVHEACHAVTAVKVRRHLTIDIATIEKGGTYLGMVASIPPEDQFTRWRSEYEADIMVSLASLAGERIFFGGDNSSGVSGDLDSATRIATMMEGYWGMGSTVASHGVTHEVGIGGGGGRPGGGDGKPGKDREKELLEGGLGQRIEEKLSELLERTERLLLENRPLVLAVAHALESNKTLTGEDVVAIVEGRPGPLLDGRPYHTPEFLELAEEYHLAAVAAHQGHSDVHLPLPRWSQHAGDRSNGAAASNGRAPGGLSFEAPPGAPPAGPAADGPATDEEGPGAATATDGEADAGATGGHEGGGEPGDGDPGDPGDTAPPATDPGRRLRRPRD